VTLYLEREGFKTVVAYDGDRALELVQRTNPIFVVLDLMLPKMDGWEVCRAIRRSSDVPILILTAREEEMDRVLGLSLGAADYVVKPRAGSESQGDLTQNAIRVPGTEKPVVVRTSRFGSPKAESDFKQSTHLADSF